MIKKEFKGVFKKEFENFVTYKQSLGYYKNLDKKKIYEILSVNDFLDLYNLDEIKITEDMFKNYLEKTEGLSQSTRHHLECTFRQFSVFLKNQGYDDIYISNECIIKMPRDYIPYVFSDDEIKRIFKTVDNYKFYRNQQLVIFYQTIFRLLYCTGLRLGEALNLKVEDVDLENNIIHIYSGKGNVSRIVPFKQSLGVWLIKYQKVFYKESDTYFFESPQNNGRRSDHNVSNFFRTKILPLCDIKVISQSGHTRGACVHTFRHTFACNALDQMIKKGKDPYCALPYLSVYLGHTSIVNTELYLRLTKQRYDEVIEAGHYIYEESLGDYNE